jgi:DNA-directed RNA polymerase subunit H
MKTKKEKEEEKSVNIFQSSIVPVHELMNAEEKADLLKKFGVSLKQIPRIKDDDAAVKMLGAKRGDVIRIIRRSPVAGEYYYYRVVV